MEQPASSVPSTLQRVIHFYDTKYKQLMIIPIILFILAMVQIGVQVATTGDFINKGVSLKGGSVITVLQPADIDQLQQSLAAAFPQFSISVRGITDAGALIGITIESAAQTSEDIEAIVALVRSQISLTDSDITIEITGAALGEQFFAQTFRAMIAAFVLMGIVVFIYFRSFIPSVAVILAAFSDIVETIAIFNLLGMSLSTAGVAAFLMLIGYSVDTDILLTSRVLKRTEGTVLERIISSIKTGLTMTMTTLTAVIAALIFTNSEVIRQIMVILLIGLLLDMINTWIQNAGIVRMYAERKHAR
ncbi:MAG TPA: protein translocase subunit SecF [Candidatus Nanoarchaeia archaeon]|nr:protein translocase subunit SecF [Candidatus Nanoarchaeia archaeon]